MKREVTKLSKPLNTERTTTRAIVPMVTPATEIPEMMLITLCDFFDFRYRQAMYNGNLTGYGLFHSSDNKASTFAVLNAGIGIIQYQAEWHDKQVIKRQNDKKEF